MATFCSYIDKKNLPSLGDPVSKTWQVFLVTTNPARPDTPPTLSSQ
jgi:hypothetical protein